ncbi:MAG: pyridoxine 5'-phosphate synthase [Alphaproteobacteria bacterium]|jgi:pyridoxine 5-phosphate synthase|nr:pyridoxine 5'-phosphate synthase [Alphaproteobacteria bacterium]MDP7172998.1 pyridoxine 5'-phosphate synthase [Alphaproteobacteria bacterium]MDP7234145.1 pyridoxine 5'-phosphate synthase [Alphaproteobacteria bacterium]MDP7488427.1 pyridoxine 5'-phosphate synthase [Alphaproteobacteria bacterium]
MIGKPRLGVNIDHVATIRNARGGARPDPLRAARMAAEAGADGITAHLREDRRHISDNDIRRIKAEVDQPLNLEMAATEEMLAIALATRPDQVCLVPEKRAELTTEGGLDVAANDTVLEDYIARLGDAGIRVSLFIDPERVQIAVAEKLGADVVELHTGSYCDAPDAAREGELARLAAAATEAAGLGLQVHAGHGLSYSTVGPVAALVEVSELNIGHFLIGEAIFSGLESAIRRMRALMDTARAEASGQRSA